mmetsp:Transcript_25712/g.36300  ORF Transcript_25712/g.36300 Transcript_25712/m.36300 type:complete len:207 (+) Transcript_25712:118-738(+)
MFSRIARRVHKQPRKGPEAEQLQSSTLFPRAQRTFYHRILAGQRLWQRPPDDHCDRCAAYHTKKARLVTLQNACYQLETDPGYEVAEAIFNTFEDGKVGAFAELRDLQKALPHVLWKELQRKYLKDRELHLKPNELLLQLNYGGFQDSRNHKVSCWSVTALGPLKNQGNDWSTLTFSSTQPTRRQRVVRWAPRKAETQVFSFWTSC